ncbi:MAG: hypothetical protein WCJ30_16545 [Deltaproteobacteria bacterium]
MRTTILVTPQLPLLVDASVFDAFAWNTSRVLEWRSPGPGIEVNPLDGDLPLRMAFVLRAPWTDVPTETARLHVGRAPYGLGDEQALAPYAIDDATDMLHAQLRDAHATFWLAADNLNALFWGMHDWGHFHNHGPFVERTATEVQCDTSALAWLWINRAAIPLDDGAWAAFHTQVLALHQKRVADDPPRVSYDDRWLRDPMALREAAGRLT